MLFVNMYISTFLLYLYYCTYSARAILLVSTCLNPKFRFKLKNDHICEIGRFLIFPLLIRRYPSLHIINKRVPHGTVAANVSTPLRPRVAC
jgi:hypothetical protein